MTGPSATPSRMRARARVGTHWHGGGTRFAVLRSQAPLSLRPTIRTLGEPWGRLADTAAHLCLTAGAAGPLGGDELRLEVEVGEGSGLVLTESSATVVLPGYDGAESCFTTRVRVAPGGTFVWLPQPVIATHGCRHRHDVWVDLASDARLVIREQVLLGRKGEESGRLRQRIRVRRGGRPLLAQDLDLGTDTSRSAVVVGCYRALGSMLVVDPQLTSPCMELLDDDGVILPLAGGNAVFVNVLSADSIGLRDQLSRALALICEQIAHGGSEGMP